MENDPKTKTRKTGKTAKTGEIRKKNRAAGRKNKDNTDKNGDTIHSRLKKALAPHEKALSENPDDSGAWAGKAAVFLRHRMYKDALKASRKGSRNRTSKILHIFMTKVLPFCSLTRKKKLLKSLTNYWK